MADKSALKPGQHSVVAIHIKYLFSELHPKKKQQNMCEKELKPDAFLWFWQREWALRTKGRASRRYPRAAHVRPGRDASAREGASNEHDRKRAARWGAGAGPPHKRPTAALLSHSVNFYTVRFHKRHSWWWRTTCKHNRKPVLAAAQQRRTGNKTSINANKIIIKKEINNQRL